MRKFLLTSILCVISFLAGTAINTLYIAEKALTDMNKITELLVDPELQVRRDIHLYERSKSEPDSISNALRFFILTKYDWNHRCQGQFCDELNMNGPSYKTNQVIIEFLNKYPVHKCQNLEAKQRVECNLEFVP
ncbi:hypothetical protein [Pseudocolwellia agarivorans]|uniref:hypothetical protein n=1 Tax=Pseudocolwellia agarivorans TaxID=1911682 RepID=UPI003F882A94